VNKWKLIVQQLRFRKDVTLYNPKNIPKRFVNALEALALNGRIIWMEESGPWGTLTLELLPNEVQTKP